MNDAHMGPRLAGLPEPVPHEVARERLLEVLHRHSQRPLVLLIAPAGFGKSTLAAAYARQSGAVVAWLTLEMGDRDPRALFGRLAGALEAAFGTPGGLTELRAGLAAGGDGVGLARLLLADLGQAPAGFIIVLDDFHVVQDTEQVRAAIDTLVRGLPEMGQVVLTGREPPALSLTQMVAGGGVFALGVEDLRFSAAETLALRQRLGGPAGDDARAEGWVAGILLGGAPRQLGLGGGPLLGTYVDREVLARLGPGERRWLEALAVLETITPEAAARLLGPGAWSGRLAALAARCPFLGARGDGAYRLHALLREALLDRLRRGPPRRAARVWAAARQLAEEADDTAGVVRACQELGLHQEASARVLQAATEAQLPGRWSAVLALLELLPEDARRRDPRLALSEAHALLQCGQPEAAQAAAEAALRHGGRSGEVVVQVGASLELAAGARYRGDLAAADDWLTAADYLLAHSRLPPASQRQLQGRALGLRGVCQAVRGASVEARALLASAERLLALGGPSRELAVVQQNLGKLSVRVGALAEARAQLAAAASHWRLIGDGPALAATQCSLGALCLRMGDLNGAGTALLSALEQARAVGAVRVEAHTLTALAEWHRASGRLDEAVAQLQGSLQLAQELGERELLVSALQLGAELAIAQDDLAGARALLARGQAEAQRLGAEFEQAGIELALGRLHLAEGDGPRAVQHISAALRRGADAWGPAERLQATYWLGTAQLSCGQARLAEAALAETLSLARQTGGAAALAVPAAENPGLLQAGLQSGLEPLVLAEAARLAATRRPWTGVPSPPTLALVAANDLPRLEARLFGPFTLHRDGQLLGAGQRGHLDRARELLALLLLHPAGMADRDLASLLWPPMAPQRALHNLRMTAYLLRRLLGAKAAVRYAGASYSLAPQLELWADVRAFDAALVRARQSPPTAAAAELAAAVALYRGPLLAEVAWPWVEPLRLRYQARLIDAALRLAELEAPADPAKSDDLAEQVLALEPDNEPAYQRLLANAHAQRSPTAIAHATHRYQRAAARFGFPGPPAAPSAGSVAERARPRRPG